MNENRYDTQYEEQYQQERWYEHDGMNWQKTVFMIGMLVIAVAFITAIVFVGRLISGYNDLVDARENVDYAEAQVETMMQRRIEMVPDLLKIANISAGHEKDLVDSVTNARAALSEKLGTGDIQAISEADNELTLRLTQLLEIVEDYPEVAASKQYTRVMDEVSGSVTRIAMERENYNSEVTKYNKLVKRFPGNILAKMFGFEELPQFQASRHANDSSIIDID